MSAKLSAELQSTAAVQQFEYERASVSAATYVKEGNLQLYTESNKHTRSQNQYKQQINRLLSQFYLLAIDNDVTAQYVTHEQYIQLHNILTMCVYGAQQYDTHIADALAEHDWQHDAAAADILTEQQYKMSIYEIADIWTLSTEYTEYIEFLRILYARAAKCVQLLRHNTQQEDSVTSCSVGTQSCVDRHAVNLIPASVSQTVVEDRPHQLHTVQVTASTDSSEVVPADMRSSKAVVYDVATTRATDSTDMLHEESVPAYDVEPVQPRLLATLQYQHGQLTHAAHLGTQSGITVGKVSASAALSVTPLYEVETTVLPDPATLTARRNSTQPRPHRERKPSVSHVTTFESTTPVLPNVTDITFDSKGHTKATATVTTPANLPSVQPITVHTSGAAMLLSAPTRTEAAHSVYRATVHKRTTSQRLLHAVLSDIDGACSDLQRPLQSDTEYNGSCDSTERLTLQQRYYELVEQRTIRGDSYTQSGSLNDSGVAERFQQVMNMYVDGAAPVDTSTAQYMTDLPNMINAVRTPSVVEASVLSTSLSTHMMSIDNCTVGRAVDLSAASANVHSAVLMQHSRVEQHSMCSESAVVLDGNSVDDLRPATDSSVDVSQTIMHTNQGTDDSNVVQRLQSQNCQVPAAHSSTATVTAPQLLHGTKLHSPSSTALVGQRDLEDVQLSKPTHSHDQAPPTTLPALTAHGISNERAAVAASAHQINYNKRMHTRTSKPTQSRLPTVATTGMVLSPSFSKCVAGGSKVKIAVPFATLQSHSETNVQSLAQTMSLLAVSSVLPVSHSSAAVKQTKSPQNAVHKLADTSFDDLLRTVRV